MTLKTNDVLSEIGAISWKANFREKTGRDWRNVVPVMLGFGGLYATYWCFQQGVRCTGDTWRVGFWWTLAAINFPSWLLFIFGATCQAEQKIEQLTASPNGVRVWAWRSRFSGDTYKTIDEFFDWSHVTLTAGSINVGDVEQAGPGLIVEIKRASILGPRIEMPETKKGQAEAFVNKSMQFTT